MDGVALELECLPILDIIKVFACHHITLEKFYQLFPEIDLYSYVVRLVAHKFDLDWVGGLVEICLDLYLIAEAHVVGATEADRFD